MGTKNYLIEGVSGTGKTSVCRALQQRGYRAVNGDRELAYQGDPKTGEPLSGRLSHAHHIWDIAKVRALISSDDPVIFFCGGSRNFSQFIDLFDGVFILEIDHETLNRRLEQRPRDEWGAKQSERDLIIRLHQTREDLPQRGVSIDATQPLADVVEEIIRRTKEINGGRE